jgi:peptide/nickel transport system substrate-binding protein
MGAFNFDINVSQRGEIGTVPNPDDVPSDFFQDIKMREAFALAFDYDDYITNVAKGLSFRLSGIIPVGMYGYDPTIDMPDYDLSAAKVAFNQTKWVTDSGYNPGGYSGGFSLTVGYNSGNTNRQRACEILKAGVEALGPNIHINVVGFEWATYLSLTLHTASGVPGPVGLFFIGWGPDYADPDDYVVPFGVTGGTYPAFTGFSNTSLDALINQAASIPNSAQRLALYDQIQASIVNDHVYILVSEAKNFHVARDWVKGWYFNPMISGADLGCNLASIDKS